MRCELCSEYATDTHHLLTRGRWGRAALVPDNEIHLCRRHHSEAHALGRETFAVRYGLESRLEKAKGAVWNSCGT